MSDDKIERQLTKLEDEVTELRGLLVEANGQTIDAMEREQKLLAERDSLRATLKAYAEARDPALNEMMSERDSLRAALERANEVVTAARELLWAFEHTYDDPGPGSRIPTLRRVVDRALTSSEKGRAPTPVAGSPDAAIPSFKP